MLLLGLNTALGQDKNHITLVEGGILSYGPATKELGFSFRAVHSVGMFPDLYTGIGTGYEKYMLNEVDSKSYKVLPLFAQAKYVHRAEKKTTLFFALDLGYGLGNLNKEVKTEFEKTTFKGGVLASPQIGAVFNTKRRQEFLTLSIGYKYQAFTEDSYYNYRWGNWNSMATGVSAAQFEDYDNFTTSKYHMHRVSVMLGFGF